MNTEQWDKVQELFEQALRINPANRREYLQDACGGDNTLMDEVESLLEADLQTHDLLRSPALDNFDFDASFYYQGQQVGIYRIVSRIGTGGMGDVFLAERADGHFEQRVALKLIRPGMDSGEVLRRFRSERQILARLQHPDISRLLDGGITERGLPFFTMEYVEGKPIDQYCDEHRLPIRQRLQLFAKVCSAVQYAHQNLVIHRDLKPSNILVDEQGHIKLLDFGIATLLAGREEGNDLTQLTREGQRVMTPEYASPEQVKGAAVTTASDVYSLGVVLYQLLTGHLPYKLPSRSPVEIERIVSETEPLKPSTLIKKTGQTATPEIDSGAIGRSRSVQPGRLSRLLSGDLDNICLKSLQKEPDQRYQSADQLYHDIQHYLNGLPVMARPATAVYRIRKFIRRHRTGVFSAAAMILLIILTISFYTVRLAHQRDLARLETRKAERISEFLTGIFQVSDPGQSKGETVTARELLERGAARLDQELADEPEVQAAMMHVIGSVYISLGLYDQAMPLVEKSLEIRRQLFGEDHKDVAESLVKLGEALREKGEFEQSEEKFREGLQVLRKIDPEGSPDIAATLNNLGWVLNDAGKYDESEDSFREAIRIFKANDMEWTVENSTALNNLALLLHEKGDLREAELLFRQALAIQRKLLGEVHPEVSTTMYNLAKLLRELGAVNQATEMLQQVVKMDRQVLGNEHPYLAYSLISLGSLIKTDGKYHQAEQLMREALKIRRKSLGPEHPETLICMNNLGELLQELNRNDEAVKLHREALRLCRKIWGNEHPEVSRSLRRLAEALHAQKQDAGVEEMFREGLQINRKVLGEDHPFVAHSLVELANFLSDKGKFKEGEPMIRQAISIYRHNYGELNPAIASAWNHLGNLYQQMGKADSAETCYLRSVRLFEKTLPGDHPHLSGPLLNMGKMLLNRHQAQQAEPYLQRALQIRLEKSKENLRLLAPSQLWYANCLAALGRFPEAEKQLQDTYGMLQAANPKLPDETRETLSALTGLYESWGKNRQAAQFRQQLTKLGTD
ncbi:MAG: tetratricopeptide repeat protein [Calditrichia bacterium]